MRLLALTAAVAVFAACIVAAVPAFAVARSSAHAAVTTTVEAAHEGDRLPCDDCGEGHDEDSESETADPADDTDIELLAVLPSEFALAFVLGSAKRWTLTHARPKEDPDLADHRRPPITT